MRTMKMAAALATATMSIPAVAQNNDQGGLVNVNVSNVLNDLDLLNNSLNNNTVQVPIGVAAAVCGVNANVIAQQRNREGSYTCNASTVNQALKQAARRQAQPSQ